MKPLLYLSLLFISLTACHQTNSTDDNTSHVDTIRIEQAITKRRSFQNVAEIVADSSYSTWVNGPDSSASLALHFMYKDTLALSYSPECWLMYPYKLEGNKIVVYWDNNIDTKYEFDIVKAIDKTNKKYLGKSFMILELANDSTLKATYPLKELIEEVNESSTERTFFPDYYVIEQEVSYKD